MSDIYTVSEIAEVSGYSKVRIHQLIRELKVPTERHVGTIIIVGKNVRKYFKRKDGTKI